MAFDQGTRNRLARFVSDARILLTEEFTRQLQNEYGLDPDSGEVTGLEKLTALDDTRRETARILRETLDYYLAGKTADAKSRQDVLQRIVREQAFTILNRLCALRMAESRGILIESIAQGYQSKGFHLYARLAGTGLGEKGDAYRSYLFSLFDEFAVDLAVLFDRFSPQGRLFPRQAALNKLLKLINDPEIDQLWAEDETIGWIYQYFNTKEERKAMRDASQAPRNSRELAVRNQFFTPRYVVEFLTDNTLGRIWYEMTRGETALKDLCHYLVQRPTELFLKEGEEAPKQESADENLSQEELLKQPVYILHRPLKDPRELKMLDPACGSMHFGLYAFDLFEQIYADAWDLEEKLGKDALWRLADLEALHDTYPNREAFLRDVPRLIIERNIHGIDIDPRAVQIAGLSLWLRAQRSWQAQGIKPADRPQIRRSNIVCAEPMPGDQALLEEFLDTLTEDRLEALLQRILHMPVGQKVRATQAMAGALAHLVRTVWQEMELAGEAGSLLKIETTLREAIAEARRESEEKAPLFRVLEFGTETGVRGETGGDFWAQAEALVLVALQEYAEQASNGKNFQRHLFSGDATQGFAFIDLCRKRYDFIVMNPPFGATAVNCASWAKLIYPVTYTNLGAAFVDRVSDLLIQQGKFGIIVDIATSIRSSYANFRSEILYKRSTISSYLHLGWGVLDANVEVCCYTATIAQGDSIPVYCIDLSEAVDKGETIAKHLGLFWEKNISNGAYQVSQQEFVHFPNGTINFTLLPELRNLFIKFPALGGGIAQVKTGLSSGDNGRFYRLSWDVHHYPQQKRWIPLSNGGEFLPYYRPFQEVIEWGESGEIIKANDGAFIRNEENYFMRGLSYGKRGTYLAIHTHPRGRIFTNEGQGIFPNSDRDAFYLLGILNSKICRVLLNEYCGQHKENGYVSLLPIPKAENDAFFRIINIVSTIVDILRDEHTRELEHLETIGLSKQYIGESIKTNLDYLADLKNKLDELENSLEREVRSLYNLSETAYAYIEKKSKGCPSIYDSHFKVRENVSFTARLLIDQLVGIAFGRWDIKILASEAQTRRESSVFDRQSITPPGFWSLKGKLIASSGSASPRYPITICSSGVLSTDDGNAQNFISYLREVLGYVWDESAEKIEEEILGLLDVDRLRDYFEVPNLFFSDHLNRYSKGRRQAPIYWPLSTPSNSYTLWLYYHRLRDQTLFTCVNDFVDPKLKQVSDEASRMRQKRGRSTVDEKELERLTDFERELNDFRDELLRVAKFWKPNLNDGVQISAAPLWKLFQFKPWQKKLKETWESLEAGEYDWAHLAYSIWPERVREKCKTDKSLAIAHDLENLYVEPKTPLKKKAGHKNKSDSEMEEMFNED